MKITSREIKTLFANSDYLTPLHKPVMMVLDERFRELPDDEAWRIIAADDTNLLGYRPEVGDCDNYAFELRQAFGRNGWACGVMIVQPENWQVPHAVFFWINDSRQIRIVEPQTDEPFSLQFSVLAIIMY